MPLFGPQRRSVHLNLFSAVRIFSGQGFVLRRFVKQERGKPIMLKEVNSGKSAIVEQIMDY